MRCAAMQPEAEDFCKSRGKTAVAEAAGQEGNRVAVAAGSANLSFEMVDIADGPAGGGSA